MTSKTKKVRSYKPTELRATERVHITPAQRKFIEKRFRCRAGTYIRRVINETMLLSASEGVNNEK